MHQKIKGTFGKKQILYNLLRTKKKTNNYYIFFHGLYSSSLKERYVEIAKKIISNNLGNVLLYETSREVYSFENEKIDFLEYQKTFSGKLFKDELRDVSLVIEHLVNELIKEKDFKLNFIGFSLGGTISSFFIEKYKKYLNNIFLFGSSIETKNKKRPIVEDYPKKETILNYFSKHTGGLLLIQGTRDNVVNGKKAELIIEAAKKAKYTSIIKLRGVDHRFLKIDDTISVDKINDTIYQIVNFGFCIKDDRKR